MHPAAAKALFDEDAQHLSAALAARRGWTLHAVAYPLIDCSFSAPNRTTLRLKLACDDWNDLPPSITLHTADGTPLSALLNNPTGVFNGGPHPVTHRPFVCMRGSREYHTHPSHVADRWESLQNLANYNLGCILTQVWHAWQKGSG